MDSIYQSLKDVIASTTFPGVPLQQHYLQTFLYTITLYWEKARPEWFLASLAKMQIIL